MFIVQIKKKVIWSRFRTHKNVAQPSGFSCIFHLKVHIPTTAKKRLKSNVPLKLIDCLLADFALLVCLKL